jgi:hypothetical protein
MARLFTLHEAEAMLPSMDQWLRQAMESKKNVSAVEEQINALLMRIHVVGGIQVDIGHVVELKTAREQHAEQLKGVLGEIESSGALLKDLDIGLIDFPTLLDGEEVYLCWKLGEPSIGFWHHTSEGYAGRKQIDRDFLDRHQGSRPH